MLLSVLTVLDPLWADATVPNRDEAPLREVPKVKANRLLVSSNTGKRDFLTLAQLNQMGLYRRNLCNPLGLESVILGSTLFQTDIREAQIILYLL